MPLFLETVTKEFQRYKQLADEALVQLGEEAFFQSPVGVSNSPAKIVKHLAGNLQSRWSDFLTTDGEKPNRQRDMEFQITQSDSRVCLMENWESSWKTLFQTLSLLKPDQMDQKVTIRGEAISVQQALVRALAHASYHIGQITYLSRWLNPNGNWLTIPPGKSLIHPAESLEK